MKANEFKKILKPLVKQTIKEVLLEGDVLSKVIRRELDRGSHQPTAEKENKQKEELYEKQKKQRIKRLNESSGLNSQIFNGVKEISESNSESPLSGVRSDDRGVDISAIEKLSNGKWKILAGDK
jgi:hypothetical protein